MSEKEIKCPSCYDGKLATLQHHPVMDCPDCNGTGVIKAAPEWQKDGKHLKEHRVHVLKVGLRDFCIRYGLDPATVSKVERGIIKMPDDWGLYYGLKHI